MLKKQFLVCLMVLFGLLHMGAGSAATLSFDPSSQTVGLGDTFDVDVVISDLGGALVGGFEFTVDFDPLVLASTGVDFSNALGDPLFGEAITDTSADNVLGTVDAFNVSLLFFDFELAAIQTTPSFTLATLSFEALSIGHSSLDFLGIVISDEFAFEIGSQGLSGDVSVVPLPGAVWLMITGLLGIGAMARKRA